MFFIRGVILGSCGGVGRKVDGEGRKLIVGVLMREL